MTTYPCASITTPPAHRDDPPPDWVGDHLAFLAVDVGGYLPHVDLSRGFAHLLADSLEVEAMSLYRAATR